VNRRSAVVTGASKGLGRGIAVALAADGCDVVVNWNRSEAEAKETARAVEAAGGQAVLAHGDVADAAVSDELAALALDAFGALDVWVNNAGVSVLAPVAETPAVDMERMVAVNLMGTFHGLQTAARTMTAARTAGRIVNVASEAAVLTFKYLGAYAATKFAVVGLTQAAAIELGEHGITVNAIAPGAVRGERVEGVIAARAAALGRPASDVERELFVEPTALKRMVGPDDVAATAAFLASDDAANITGETISVSAGFRA
jgi:NAD(P)-dependent dehydrogenase (short-subunit alcohol dehydrogenase family)